MKKHDSDHCPGAICEGDTTPNWKNNVIWYPGEKVCGKTPYTHAQKVQLRLNKLFAMGKLRNPYTCFTWEMLNRRRAVTSATEGMNPNEDVEKKEKRNIKSGKVFGNLQG